MICNRIFNISLFCNISNKRSHHFIKDFDEIYTISFFIWRILTYCILQWNNTVPSFLFFTKLLIDILPIISTFTLLCKIASYLNFQQKLFNAICTIVHVFVFLLDRQALVMLPMAPKNFCWKFRWVKTLLQRNELTNILFHNYHHYFLNV